MFISYSSKDIDIVLRIKNKIENKDYPMFFAPSSIPAGAEYSNVIATAITDASKDGCVIALLTPNSPESHRARREIMFAIAEGGNVNPVMSGNVQLSQTMQLCLCTYYLSKNPTDEETDDMIEKIRQTIIK